MVEKFQPSNMTAELEMDLVLELLKLGDNVNASFNAVVKVNAMYAVDKSDADLIELMVRKVNLATYPKMIIDYLNAVSTNNFKRIFTKISTVQQLAGIDSNSKSKKNSDKEIAVMNANGSLDKKKASGGGGG